MCESVRVSPLSPSASCLSLTVLNCVLQILSLRASPLVCLSTRLLPCILSLSLSGSSLREEQISRWFPAGIHFLCHSYFYRTVITLNHSPPLSLKTHSALRPSACRWKFPAQTTCHISCEKRVFRVRDLHELNKWIGEQANCFVYTYFPWYMPHA